MNTNLMVAGIPTAPKRRRAFTAGYLVQAVGLAGMIGLGLIHPAAMLPQHQYVWVSLAPPPPVNHAPQRIPPKLLAATQGEND